MKYGYFNLFALFFFVLFPIISNANNFDCADLYKEAEPVKSSFLSTRVTEARIISSEEDMGWVLMGKVDNGPPQKLGRINTHYSDDPEVLMIDEVAVFPDARELGVATTLYEFLLKQRDSRGIKTKQMRGTAKVATNLEAFLKPLMENLSGKKGYVKPNPKGSVLQQFFECCRNIYAKHPADLAKATESSPTYKIGKKLGFDLCPGSIELNVSGAYSEPIIGYNYALCR